METSKENFIPEVKLDLNSLPSKGKAYKDGAEISYRGYLFGEVQKMSSSKNTNYEDMLRLTLSGIKCNFNPLDITLPDLLYIGVARKISSLGTMQFSIDYKCENDGCDSIEKAIFSQNDITFHDLDVEEMPLEFELSNKKTYQMSPITIGNFFDLCNNGRFSKALNRKDLMKDPTAIYAAQVRNHNFQNAYTDFYSLTDATDQEILQEVDKMLLHDMNGLKHSCTKCGTHNEIQLEGREPLIMPFREGAGSIRHRIRIGSKHKSESNGNEIHGV